MQEYDEQVWQEALERHGEPFSSTVHELLEDHEGGPLGVAEETFTGRVVVGDVSELDAIAADLEDDDQEGTTDD